MDNFFVKCFLVISLVFIFAANDLKAQPFLDIVNTKYSNSPNTGLGNKVKNDVRIRYYNVSTNLPIQFNTKDALIFSPFFETWQVQIKNNVQQHYYGIALPVSLVKSIPYTRWSVLLTGIVRMNDSSISKRTNMQAGGAFIVNYERKKNLTWKLGLYVNNELFGLFVMPLAGIDWKINERNNLFGVLPGNLTYEHKINDRFYYGANFRAITNSYGNANGYWRIDENQLGLYLDTYFNKNIVLNVETGHSFYRNIRTGIKNVSENNAGVKDNLYARIHLAYRIRFEKSKIN